jgi:hypothetical protein
MSGVEYGDEGVKSPFPKEWGRPVGDAYSEERALWVKRKVREHLAGTSMRQLRMKQLQMLVHLRQRLYEGEQDG